MFVYIHEGVVDVLVAKMERLEDQIQSFLFAQVPPRTMSLMWNRAFSQYYGEDANRIYEDRVKVCLPQRLGNLSLSQRVL
jgi:hypothetical protein